MALSANEAEVWWPHGGEPGSLQAAYFFLTTGFRPSRKTSGTFKATSNTSGFLAWTPKGSSSGRSAPLPTPTCPRLVCPGHLGKHLGTAGSGWLPALQAGGTLQSEQCIPGSSLEHRPVYFLRGGSDGKEAISEPAGRLFFPTSGSFQKNPSTYFITAALP